MREIGARPPEPDGKVFLSPDARTTRAVGFDADKQTELRTWTVIVKTGTPSAAALQRYAVVVTGGVCLGSSVHLDRTQYVCNQPAVVTVNEKDEAGDSLASLTDSGVAARTALDVFSVGADGVFGTSDDVLTDAEDASSTNQFAFTHSGGKYTSAAIPVTDGDGTPQPGDGVLDVTSGSVIRVTYRDRTSGAADANKVRTSSSPVDCRPAVTVGGVTFAQFGLDTSQVVGGGCERDGRGLFTFGFPDRYGRGRVDHGPGGAPVDGLDLTDVSEPCAAWWRTRQHGGLPAGNTQCSDPNC
jgi:hypothetical protein